jgi:sec-independent protein translocase protein TatC
MRDDEKADLVTHLEELRTRIIRALVYLTIGVCIAWAFYKPVLAVFITHPLDAALKASGGTLTMRTVMEPFTARLNISLISGLIIALVPMLWEIWGFVRPGLTPNERRVVRGLIPGMGMLFLTGVATCYLVLPFVFRWVVSQRPPGVEYLPSYGDYAGLAARFFLAFGLTFQMPIAIMLLVKIGVVSAADLRRRWRHAYLIICVLAAVATPGGDLASPVVLAVALVFLYELSIFLARRVERADARARADADTTATPIE